MYAYKENNRWVYPVGLRSRFKGVGGFHTLTDAQRAQHGWYPLNIVNGEYDEQTQNRFFVSEEFENDVLVVTYRVEKKDIETQKIEAKEALKKLRQQKQLEPMDIFGFTEVFSPETIALFTGKALKASLDSTITCQWKTPSGFVTLTAEQIMAIAKEVDNKIQALFDKESELSALMDSAENPFEILKLWE